VIHIKSPPKTSGDRFVAEPWVIDRLFKSYSSREGMGGYQTFAEIFYCIILQTGRYLLHMYATSARPGMIPSVYLGERESALKRGATSPSLIISLYYKHKP
jgi:hypothetical protein